MRHPRPGTSHIHIERDFPGLGPATFLPLYMHHAIPIHIITQNLISRANNKHNFKTVHTVYTYRSYRPVLGHLQRSRIKVEGGNFGRVDEVVDHLNQVEKLITKTHTHLQLSTFIHGALIPHAHNSLYKQILQVNRSRL